jgi:hypothetical protein
MHERRRVVGLQLLPAREVVPGATPTSLPVDDWYRCVDPQVFSTEIFERVNTYESTARHQSQKLAAVRRFDVEYFRTFAASAAG